MTQAKKEYMKKYREKYKEEIKEYQKKYREKYKEEIKENRGVNKENAKLYREQHKEEIKENYKQHKEERKEYKKEYRAIRRKNDISFKITENLRSRLNSAAKKKSGHTIDLLGCDIDFFLQHIENKFQPGMSWDNYGLYGWHIDHIKPCAAFNLLNENEQKQCFHYTNLQPLWAEDNLRKSDKWCES